MPRTKTIVWTYECDELGCGNHWPNGPGHLTVTRGDACSTGRGTVVHDQADADAVARRDGWTVGRHVLCPNCTRGRP